MTHADWQRDVQSGIYIRSTRNQIKFFPESSHDDSNAGWPWTCPDLHYCHQRLAVLSTVPCIPSVYLLSPLSTIWHIHWQHCTLVSVSLFVLYILTSVCAVYSPLSLSTHCLLLFYLSLSVDVIWTRARVLPCVSQLMRSHYSYNNHWSSGILWHIL